MFTFWYPERFNTLKQTFKEHIKKQKSHDPHNISLYISSDIAVHFLEAIDVLMNLTYWTDHVDDVVYLLEQAKACYVDEDYTKIEEMQQTIRHLFTHLHAENQLDLHLTQYALCTLMGLSIFYTPREFPLLHLYSLYRGLSGLGCNCLTRMDVTREYIDLFVASMMHAQEIQEYQLTLGFGSLCG